MAWELYDKLIAGVPEGVAVTDFCKGASWCYVEAECGLGIAKTVTGGAAKSDFCGDLRELDLRGVAALSKSWKFSEASMGVAALNAWYSQIRRLEEIGAHVDAGDSLSGQGHNPFSFMKQSYEGKKLAVVGHFPNVEAAARVAHVTVLERNCTSPLDVPDPACEFILPEQDFAFVTGTTLSNKTMPRLLQLCRHPFTIITGPSAIPSRVLIDAGANMIAGSVVVDADQAKLAVRGGSKQQWRAGIKKFSWES